MDYHKIILLLFGGFAALPIVSGLNRITGKRLIPRPHQRALRQAGLAILEPDRQEAATSQPVQMPEGGTARIPLEGRYEARRAVATVLELERLREKAASLRARIHTGSRHKLDLGSEPMTRLKDIWADARSLLTDFLKIDETRAEPVLYLLGWQPLPPSGTSNTGAQPTEHRSPDPKKLLQDQNLKDMPWRTTASRLREEHDLSDHEIARIQCSIVRQECGFPLTSGPNAENTERALTRHAALTPPQARAVLAMSAARRLIHAGPDGMFQLINLLRHRPDLARPLLAAQTHKMGIQRQVMRAVEQLNSGDDEQIREELRALGPYTVEMLTRLRAAGKLSDDHPAGDILRDLRKNWPDGEKALEILGDNPDTWRRFYRNARETL
ncbi:MAG: hypothetical protein ACOCSQ_04020 [Planctomycetota bacterium]